MHLGGVWRPVGTDGGWEHCCTVFASDRASEIVAEPYRVYLEGSLFEHLDPERSPERTLEVGYGCYSYIFIDYGGKQVIVGTDRLGFSTLYYHLAPDGSVYFSSNINWLKSQIGDSAIDRDALEDVLNLGEVLGTRTLLSSIKRLAAGVKMVFSGSKATFVRHWEPEMPDFCDERSFLDGNISLMQEAIERTRSCPQRKFVFLSGGEDSRRIAATAARCSLDFSLATQVALHSGNVDNDVILAAKVAALLGREIHVEAMAGPQKYLQDCDFSDYWLGFESIQMGWLAPLLRHIPEGSLIYDGIAGDVLINGHFVKRYHESLNLYRDNGALAGLILKDKEVVEVAGTTASLKDRIVAELELISPTPHKITLFYLLNHTRRHIALNAQLFKVFGCDICYPFLYYPLFMQSLSLPPDQLVKKNYQHLCTVRINPELGRCPSTRDKPLPPQYLIDLSQEVRRRQIILARNAHLKRSAVRSYLPDLLPYMDLYRVSRLLRFAPAMIRGAWAGRHFHFVSRLSDWAQNGLACSTDSLGGKQIHPLRQRTGTGRNPATTTGGAPCATGDGA